MANEFSLKITAGYTKNGVTEKKDFTQTVTIAGDTPLSTVQNIGTADETLTLGDITTPGYLVLKNQAALVEVTTPAAPVVTNAGAPGSTTVSYKIVAKQTDGSHSAASSAGTTSTAAATLDNTNFNTITWVNQTAATGGYDIYRTTAGGTPSSTGLIASVGAGVTTYNDQGAAGDSSSAPSTGIDNVILFGANGSSYPNQLKGQEVSVTRWNGAAIHAKANTAACDVEYLLLPD
jgi:hypothetical protein